MLKSFIRPVSGNLLRYRVIRPDALRFQSTKNSGKSDKTVDFKTFIIVSIFASIILTQVVDAVNQEKPRGQKGMSEAEYYKMQQRLKRKVSLFTPEEKKVILYKDGSVESIDVDALKLKGIEVVDPLKLVEQEKLDKASRFFDLLNDSDLKELPRGLTIDLIGKALKNSSSGKFIVVGFPKDVKEAIQFEEKVVTIKNLLISEKADKNDDVFRYYKTVSKSVVADDKLDSLLD